jgi:hypothetical protein
MNSYITIQCFEPEEWEHSKSQNNETGTPLLRLFSSCSSVDDVNKSSVFVLEAMKCDILSLNQMRQCDPITDRCIVGCEFGPYPPPPSEVLKDGRDSYLLSCVMS